MPESEFQRMLRDPRKRRLYEQERLIVDATELIAQVMQGEAPWQLQGKTRHAEEVVYHWFGQPPLQLQRPGKRGLFFSETDRVREVEILGEKESALREKQWAVKKAELAERLGKSRAYVTQVLGGSRNMTLRTLADFAFALGFRVELRAAPLDGEKP